MILSATVVAISLAPAARGTPFRIDIVDQATGRGVPMVRLSAAGTWAYSDSNGVVAWTDLLDKGRLTFTPLTDGYELAHSSSQGIVGNAGVELNPTSGGRAVIKLNRTQVAERLYRLTGQGIYSDSVMVNASSPIADPILAPAGITGQDGGTPAVYKGLAYWFWGDTNCARYDSNCGSQRDNWNDTAAIFTTGATSVITQNPPSLKYFTRVSGGFENPAQMAPVQPMEYKGKSCRTWIGSVCSFTDEDTHEEVLMAIYMKPDLNKPGPMLNQARGLLQWSDTLSRFRTLTAYHDPSTPCTLPQGCTQTDVFGMYTVHRLGPDADPNYVYFGKPFTHYRVRRSVKAMANQSAWESFSPLKPGTDEVDPAGYGWKTNLSWFGQAAELRLIQQGKLSRSAARMQVKDPAGNIGRCDWNSTPIMGNGDVQYNNYLKQYVLIAQKAVHPCEKESTYGEIWLSLAPNITGPWNSVHRIATHATTGSSCYNPLQLPFLEEGGGSRIYFACTVTSAFSYSVKHHGTPKGFACAWDGVGGRGCSVAIPKYEYNNMVFAVDTQQFRENRDGHSVR